ncbi:MAG: PaaX family transcriptional regulator C-terminal domain-containing protein [Actinomycetota bacterium]
MTSVASPVPTVDPRAAAWTDEAAISARSALVTILGDTVAPLGGTIWLADVFTLAAPFGFNERLVRTSMFRLAAVGWVDSERVGRRSRYSLGPDGRAETAAAEQRIYRRHDRPWDGSWTLVFLPNTGSTTVDGDIARHLRWRGFARMADGVHAHPNDDVVDTRELLDRLGIDPAPAVAVARFDGDGEAPLAGLPFRVDSGLDEAEAAYQRFVDRYRPIADAIIDEVDEPTPLEAFALRTMLVHDLRRARLRDPDLPTDLLPDGWVGHRAAEVAADLYRRITEPAWAWVTEATGLTVEPDRVAGRFTTHPTAGPTPAR